MLVLDKEGPEWITKEEITTVAEGSGSGVNNDQGGDEFREGAKGGNGKLTSKTRSHGKEDNYVSHRDNVVVLPNCS